MKLTIAAVALAAASPVLAGCPKQCYTEPASLQLSCHYQNFTTLDTCCLNSPGGFILQTQFWDYAPAAGPEKSWTVHGLWPDNCDGTYAQYCDDRQYKNITQILESYGQQSLLQTMRSFWVSNDGNEESFWEHEWGKHGTCMSTLEPRCYSNYSPQEEVVDYFRRTVSLYQSLDSYSFLARAGITPSSSKNYTLTDVENAFTAARGVSASPQCDSSGALTQVYYYFNTIGSISQGQFVPASPDGAKSNCPASLVYPPKQNGTAVPTQTPSSSAAATKSLQMGPTCRPNGI